MTIKLKKPFAANTAVDEFDVKQIKNALNRLGYYRPYEKVGMTGIPDTQVFGALKSFQKDHGLLPTGTAKPGDETILVLSREASKTPKGYYVWRTKEDDKVRPSHAARNHEVRAWNDAPDPHQEINCRCWADPATPEQIAKKKKQKCFDALPWEGDAKENVKKHEEDWPYPYLDTVSKITVGYGINIDKKGDFMDLPWKIGSISGPDATKKEIEDGYQALHGRLNRPEYFNKKGDFNVLPAKQKGWANNLYLPDDARSQLFNNAYSGFLNALPGKFSGFDCFPPKAKVALMDMIYNLGATKFSLGSWPDLFSAVNQRDWDTAAEECHRLKIPEDRNTDTRNQFKEAAEMERESQQKN